MLSSLKRKRRTETGGRWALCDSFTLVVRTYTSEGAIWEESVGDQSTYYFYADIYLSGFVRTYPQILTTF